MSDGRGQAPSPVVRRILMAMLPIGLVFLAAYVIWVGILVATGNAGSGTSWASVIIDLVMCLVLITSGWAYRRALTRR
jgi:hypothetical protein